MSCFAMGFVCNVVLFYIHIYLFSVKFYSIDISYKCRPLNNLAIYICHFLQAASLEKLEVNLTQDGSP